jgi:probable F420-dependent oxidoreductase
VKIGWQIPHVWHWSGAKAVDAFIDRVEELGYDSLWAADHIVIPEQISASYPYNEAHTFGPGGTGPWPWLDPFAVLAYAAGRTRHVALGTAVLIVPYRPPLVTAKLAAGIDALSNGRLILGVGAGWMAEEFEALGIAEQFPIRGRVTDEYLAIMKAVWSQEVASYAGEFHRFERITAMPLPVQRPHPPLWVGGTTPAALRRVARQGDGWMVIQLTPDEVTAGLATLHGLLREAGRDPSALSVGMLRRVALVGNATDVAELRGRTRSGMLTAGTPDEVAEELRAFAAAGVQHVELTGGGSAEEALYVLEQFTREVLPALKA